MTAGNVKLGKKTQKGDKKTQKGDNPPWGEKLKRAGRKGAKREGKEGSQEEGEGTGRGEKAPADSANLVKSEQ